MCEKVCKIFNGMAHTWVCCVSGSGDYRFVTGCGYFEKVHVFTNSLMQSCIHAGTGVHVYTYIEAGTQ